MSEPGDPLPRIGLGLGAAALTIVIAFVSFYSALASIFDLHGVPEGVFVAQLFLPVLIMIGMGVRACVRRRWKFNGIGFAVSFAATVALAVLAAVTADDCEYDEPSDSYVCRS